MIEDGFHRFGWFLVILGGVAISSWSLFSLARSGYMPVPIAAFTGLVYDGLAFVSSVQAMKWNRLENASGISARLTMLAAACLSSWLNYSHGTIMHAPLPVKVMLASAPIAGLLALENHVRYIHRSTNKKHVPKPELGMWILFFPTAFRLLRTAHRNRLQELMGIKIPMASGSISNETMRDWLRTHGYDIGTGGPISKEHKAIYAQSVSLNGLNGDSQPTNSGTRQDKR